MESPLGLLRSEPLAFVLLAVTLIIALVLHEYAHALTAYLQGDRLPRAQGRLSLNPARHLDPIGTLMIFLVGFGWARPVEFRPQALRSRRFGAAIVALAGPAMNLVLALVAASAYVPMARAFGLPEWIHLFFLAFIGINVLLAVFNLVPLPPLDGSRLLTIFLPPDKQRIIFWLDRYGFLILLALVLFGGFSLILPLIRTIEGWILQVAGAEALPAALVDMAT